MVATGDRSVLALELSQAVGEAWRAIERSGNQSFRAYGLSRRAYAALTAVDLAGADGARPSEIAERLGVSRASATTFVQRLESRGLVETTPDAADDRGVRVTLTRRGLDAVLRAAQLERRLAARAIEGMPASSVLKAVHVLQEYGQRLARKQLEVVK